MTKLLAALQVPESCISDNRSAKENRCSIQLKLPPEWTVRQVAVDGCWMRSEERKKVDILFHVLPEPIHEPSAVLLVEFKGHHVGHALDQLESTLQQLSQYSAWRSMQTFKRFGCVILSKCPQIGNYAQRRQKLTERYKIDIRFKSQQLTVVETDLFPSPRSA